MIPASMWITYIQQRQRELWREAEREAQARQLRSRTSRWSRWLKSLLPTEVGDLGQEQEVAQAESQVSLDYVESQRKAA